MTNLYKVTLRHTYDGGQTMDYDVTIEADSKRKAILQCYGPKRQVVGIRKVFRLNYVQTVVLIVLSIMASLLAIVYYFTRD